jgi:hypothetical protein
VPVCWIGKLYVFQIIRPSASVEGRKLTIRERSGQSFRTERRRSITCPSTRPGPVAGPVACRNLQEVLSERRTEHRVLRGELARSPLSACLSASFPSWTSWVRVPSPALWKCRCVKHLEAPGCERVLNGESALPGGCAGHGGLSAARAPGP